MSEVEITSEDELKKWLQDKSGEWSAVIALRSALRVLPLVSDPVQDGTEPAPQLTLPIYRAMAISSGAAKIPSDDIERRTAARIAASNATTTAAAVFARIAARATVAATRAAVAINTTRAAANRADAYAAATRAAVANANAANAASAASAFAASASAANAAASIWRALSSDCQKLSQGQAPTDLLASQLWEGEPEWYRDSAQRADRWLRDSGAGFEIWAEWYDRVRTGKTQAFDRFDQDADQVFYTRLIEKDKKWWKRDAAIVNADIAGWVEDLRRLPPPLSDAELEQNPRALMFGPTQEGRVGLRKLADPDKLDLGDEARLRHKESIESAQIALDASHRDQSQAQDVARSLEQYLDAMGKTLDDIVPSLAIARGEKLRRRIALRADSARSAIPFTEQQALSLADWETDHNLFVALDPYLSSIQRDAGDPNAPRVILDLEAIKAVIESAKEADLTTDESVEALKDATENVPVDAASDDRRRIQATEALKNFIRATGELVWRNKGKAAATVAGGGYAAASWIQRNIEWLQTVFANEPSILNILEKIAALPL